MKKMRVKRHIKLQKNMVKPYETKDSFYQRNSKGEVIYEEKDTINFIN